MKKPTYHQMFDFLANKLGYKKMMELRESQDPQAVKKAWETYKHGGDPIPPPTMPPLNKVDPIK